MRKFVIGFVTVLLIVSILSTGLVVYIDMTTPASSSDVTVSAE